MSPDMIEREAASIAADIRMLKSRPYQADDKALVAAFLRETGAAAERSDEITMAQLDLPWPIWSIIRSAYFNDAVQWSRKQKGLAA